MPKKPEMKTEEAYDYNDCIRYIEKKYKINTRDYAGKFTSKKYDETVPYQNFWHWVVNNCNPHSDGYFWILDNEEPDEPWQQEILDLINKEFGLPQRFYIYW